MGPKNRTPDDFKPSKQLRTQQRAMYVFLPIAAAGFIFLWATSGTSAPSYGKYFYFPGTSILVQKDLAYVFAVIFVIVFLIPGLVQSHRQLQRKEAEERRQLQQKEAEERRQNETQSEMAALRREVDALRNARSNETNVDPERSGRRG